MIRISNLNKTFIKDGTRIDVLKDSNLEIGKGDSLAVRGCIRLREKHVDPYPGDAGSPDVRHNSV